MTKHFIPRIQGDVTRDQGVTATGIERSVPLKGSSVPTSKTRTQLESQCDTQTQQQTGQTP